MMMMIATALTVSCTNFKAGFDPKQAGIKIQSSFVKHLTNTFVGKKKMVQEEKNWESYSKCIISSFIHETDISIVYTVRQQALFMGTWK